MSVTVCAQLFSRVQLFATLWTITCQVPLSMGFFRQEYWNELPFLSPGIFPDPEIEPASPVSPALQVKNPPAVQETREMLVRSLGQGRSLEKEMATHSSILA